MSAALHLREVITACVLRRDREMLWKAIEAFIKERDEGLTYFVPGSPAPYKTEWRKIKI